MTNDNQYWGYLHSNGTIQCKRWFGDVRDYTDDCRDNPFVVKVVPPFWAVSREWALIHLDYILKPENSVVVAEIPIDKAPKSPTIEQLNP